MSEEIKRMFKKLADKGRELSVDEVGIISALIGHEHLLVQQYEKEKKELIGEFIEVLKGMLHLNEYEKLDGYYINSEIEKLEARK